MLKRLLIITLFLGLGQAQAHEASEGQIHLSLGSYTYKTIFQDKSEVDSPLQGGGGFVVNGDIDDKGALEVGIFLLDKVFRRNVGVEVLAEKIKRVYVTLGYRYWATPWFGVGISSFTSYSMGDAVRLHSTSGGDSGFKTSAHDTSDHGIDVSLLFEVYKRGSESALIDFRYSKYLSTRSNEDADHAALFVAYKKRTK